MESTGENKRVQISSASAELLASTGCFEIESRGLIPVKGKGEVETFWLLKRARGAPTEVGRLDAPPITPLAPSRGPRGPFRVSRSRFAGIGGGGGGGGGGAAAPATTPAAASVAGSSFGSPPATPGTSHHSGASHSGHSGHNAPASAADVEAPAPGGA